MKNKNKIFYYVVTGLFSLLIMGGVANYIFQHEMVVGFFEAMGFPPNLIYYMATAKVLGVIGIWQTKSKVLREWAYAGFTFNLLLAVFAHLNVSDGEQWGAVIGLVLMSTSYFLVKKIEAEKA
ncbi:DoxX family protein [Flammeovirga yaeyamensis]|uniref:DoxX family protein n=1 Tax=Flammeovirga yaeyamensis TaxID=367791 RepID=A0AAX1N886_9BACT|nr:DoxX family protein [Flammeovirga yaeyamensis]MBB3701307.1 positive regulator of sigma E activity [Flammeovirga yaeyamensis]NMF38224.1 DoxX family protein [Flammeovirga yaeyamensis]QWG02636.1 DoxX family protein [Flammeovirga yaeyamensis]